MRFKKIARSRVILILLLIVIILVIKLISLSSYITENYFSSTLFPPLSKALRIVTGWLPFSLGDILYLLAAIWLLYKLVQFIISLVKKRSKRELILHSLGRILMIAAVIYIIFNIFWGLNYNRKGIAYQLNLDLAKYTEADLKNIQQLLIVKVNESKKNLLSTHASYPGDKELFARANECYRQTAVLYPFMQYQHASVKSSLFSWWGNYLGFSGYYNPFSGEAQVNTTVPKFILPYTTCHEMAHQLGYAREDEANFAGYLAATSSSDQLFHYSTYLDLFVYASNELYFADSASARQGYKQLTPEVRADIRQWRDFLINHRSFMDDFITWAYGRYLKANEQPQGMRTYSEVVGDLIAFYKKTGRI